MSEKHENLRKYLKQLQLKTISNIFETESEKALKNKISYTEYLTRLVEEEVISKTDRSIQYKVAKAKFTQLKTIEMFDFTFQPQLDEKYIKELSHLSFIEKCENVMFLGPPGVGKTHLATGLGIKACYERQKVQFISASELVNELSVAYATNTLSSKLSSLCRLDLLIIDELGYLPLSKETANLFFQLISRRYETGSIIITSNKPFPQWGDIFANDNTLAAAIVDRLLHHSHVLQIPGKSYRIKNKIRKLSGQGGKINA